MKNKKIKCLILIVALLITRSQLYVFSETDNSESPDGEHIPTTPPKSNNITLDGEIGEWDPNIDDKPDFSGFDGADLEGSKPTEGQYFTISATVPISMEFMVLPSSHYERGSFFSPTYKVKNNGSKTLVVKLASFEEDTSKQIDEEQHAKLFIEKVKNHDGKTQMELKLGAVHDIYWYKFSKEVDLTKIDTLNDDEKTLCELSMNQEKNIKFNSEKWERPENEVLKKSAMSNFTATFEFAIKEP